MIVQVTTNAGIAGIGGCSRYNGPEPMKAYVDSVVKTALLGKNPALWDIIGKAKGVPVYKLLAGAEEPQTRLRVYASGGKFTVVEEFAVSEAGASY